MTTTRRRSLLPLSLVFATSVAAAQAGPEMPPPVTAFVDVTVLPMDADRALAGQTVLVRDGRIAAIGAVADVAVPEGATVVPGAGRFLLPGLAEMHGHLPLPNRFLPRRWSEDALFLYVANGVTLVRGMQGREPHLEMRQKIASGALLGPRILVAGPPLHGNAIGSVEAGVAAVNEQADAGFDLLKIHEGLASDVHDAIARTARARGIPFAGHVPDDVGFFTALERGQTTIDHLDNAFEAVGGETARIGELVAALVEHDGWVVPTEVLWEDAFLQPLDPATVHEARAELKYVPRPMVAQWQGFLSQRRSGMPITPAVAADRVAFRRRAIAAIEAASQRVLLGTDSPQVLSVPGFSLHREMALMVEAGMTPYQVLESGTRRVAAYLGELDDAGTVAVGKRADLLLLEADPRRDIAAVGQRAGVLVAGRWLPEAEIQERLAGIARAYAPR